MNPRDRTLNRLAAAARTAPPPPLDDMPPGMADRVLARLRHRPDDRIWWEAMAARAAGAACAAALAMALLPAPRPPDEAARISTAVLLSALEP